MLMLGLSQGNFSLFTLFCLLLTLFFLIMSLSFLQSNNKGESSKPEFEAFTGSGKTLRQKRKN